MPVWIIEGKSERSRTSAMRLAEMRMRTLAEAIREHEVAIRQDATSMRPPDARLYRRLRQVAYESSRALTA